jgi:S1-C subfamily serine protease
MERAGTLALLVAAGATGAGATVGFVAAARGLGGTTTTVRELVASPGASVSSFERSQRGLTIHQIYVRAAPGVVQVTATARVATRTNPFLDPFGFASPGAQTQRALGSGFVVDKAGHIVTNYHVVQGATRVEVSFSDNEQMPARVVGRDPVTDLAVLQVKAHSRALTPLALGDSDSVQVGDAVVAIGNPLGEDRSITSGIVSALQRRIFAPSGAPIDHVIQTDAALNHGNSGGPLLDARGEVVGVSSQIRTAGTSDGSIGIGFAIPINTVKSVAAQLIAVGSVEHPFLGIVDVQAITSTVARLFRLPTARGLLVGTVCGATGAANAGLRGATEQVTLGGDTWPLGGDIVARVDGAPVRTVDALRTAITGKKPGDKVRLDIYRGNATKTLEVTLGQQPASSRC